MLVGASLVGRDSGAAIRVVSWSDNSHKPIGLVEVAFVSAQKPDGPIVGSGCLEVRPCCTTDEDGEPEESHSFRDPDDRDSTR
jgi:hypothetical protein